MNRKNKFFFVFVFLNIPLLQAYNNYSSSAPGYVIKIFQILGSVLFSLITAFIVSCIVKRYQRKLAIRKIKERIQKYAEKFEIEKKLNKNLKIMPFIKTEEVIKSETHAVLYLLLSMPEYLEIMRQNKILHKDSNISIFFYELSKYYNECSSNSIVYPKINETLEKFYPKLSRTTKIPTFFKYLRLILEKLEHETDICNRQAQEERSNELPQKDGQKKEIDTTEKGMVLKTRKLTTKRYLRSFLFDGYLNCDIDSIQTYLDRKIKKGIHSLRIFSKKEYIDEDYIGFFYNRKIVKPQTLETALCFYVLPNPEFLIVEDIKYSFCAAIVQKELYAGFKGILSYVFYRISNGRIYRITDKASEEVQDHEDALNDIGVYGVYYLFEKIK